MVGLLADVSRRGYQLRLLDVVWSKRIDRNVKVNGVWGAVLVRKMHS